MFTALKKKKNTSKDSKLTKWMNIQNNILLMFKLFQLTTVLLIYAATDVNFINILLCLLGN